MHRESITSVSVLVLLHRWVYLCPFHVTKGRSYSRQSFGFCRWYSGVNQSPRFDMDTSFAFLLLKHLASLESSKAQKRILCMKDYQRLKPILESKDFFCEG